MKKFLTSLFVLLACVLCVSFAACTHNSNKVMISFEVNGGTEIAAVYVDNGEDYTLPVPQRDGYEFEGWYSNEELTGSPVTQIKATENVTFYAKWAQLFTVTLDTKGGMLSETSFKLKAGANLYEALESYVPVKTDYQFYVWLNGTSPVISNTKMPSSDITLTAKYKVKYSIAIYRETFTEGEYAKDENYVIGYGEVGAVVVPELSSDDTRGFTAVQHPDEVTSLTLSENAASNLFKFYLKRNSCAVIFHANYPDGTDEIVKTETVKYGIEVVLPVDTIFDGYCLTGWADTSYGTATYTVDAITGKLFNSPSGAEVKEVKILPDTDINLYAVWVKGYTDISGGKDTIFLFDSNSDIVYLYRNGVFFLGSYRASSQMATFQDDSVYIRAKLLENGMFVYYDAERSATYYLYKMSFTDGKVSYGIDNNTSISIDAYNGIRYITLSDSSEGTFIVDDYGYYVATFTSGNLAGQTLTLLLTETTTNGLKRNVFRVRNEEEYNLTMAYRAEVKNGQLIYYPSAYRIFFYGFNGVRYYTSNTSYSDTGFLAFVDGDKLTVVSISSSGATNVYFEAKLNTIDGVTFYTIYSGKYDFTASDGNSSLVLDGYGNATYRATGENVSGYYTIYGTGFGDFLVTLYVDGSEYANFIVNVTEEGEDLVYSYVKKVAGYMEFNYTDEKIIYTATYLVLNDDGAGTASLYGNDSEGNIYKISRGTFKFVNGLYVYTKETWEVPSEVEIYFPSTDFSSFVFTFGTKKVGLTTTYSVVLWVKYTEGDSDPAELYTEYVSEDGKETLALLNFGSVAIYSFESNGETVHIAGAYSVSSAGILTLTYSSSLVLYLTVDKEEMTFERLDFAPYSIYTITPDLYVNKNVYFSLTGKIIGDAYIATYNIVDGEDTTTIAGKIVVNTTDGTYTFISDDEQTTLNFVMISTSSSSYISIYDPTYAYRYVSSAYGILELDGYGTKATLNGNSFMYRVEDENVIVLITSIGYVYVDLDMSDKSFTIRDGAYGTYLFFDNQYLNGYYFHFDGYGGLSVFKMVKGDGEDDYVREYIDENGTYEIKDSSVIVHYTNGTVSIDREGVFGTITYGSSTYRTFGFTYSEIANTYVSTSDWSVITLDGNGKAVKYDTYGVAETGSYIIVTDSLFYYVNDNSTDAALYRYDPVRAIATPVVLRARGYYTVDMESLLFSRYGFAIFNGAERYYYEIEENEIIIYQRAENDETGANKYGFISIPLGRYDATTINYGGKNYIFNDGYDITFSRTASDAAKYPVNVGTSANPVYSSVEKLIFTPSGDNAEYSVSGIAVINNKNYSCTVMRTVDEDGSVAYYVMLGNYRLTVSLEYGGLNSNNESLSAFTVSELVSINTLYSDTYLTNAYLAAVLFGQQIPNTWGIVQLVREYDEEGQENGNYVYAVFGPSSYMYDINGDRIYLERVPYEYDSETGKFSLEFEYDDEYNYTMVFTVKLNPFFRMNAYSIDYVTRSQTLTHNNYKLEIQTIIASDIYSRGLIFSMKLFEGEDEIEYTIGLSREGGLYYVSRTVDDEGKITATKYYKIDISRMEAEEGNNSVPLYDENITISKLANIKTYYAEDETSYVDIDEDGHEVLFVYIYDDETGVGTEYAVTSCKYSEDGGYTVTLSSDEIYNVKVEGDTVTLTKSNASGDSSSDDSDQD